MNQQRGVSINQLLCVIEEKKKQRKKKKSTQIDVHTVNHHQMDDPFSVLPGTKKGNKKPYEYECANENCETRPRNEHPFRKRLVR